MSWSADAVVMTMRSNSDSPPKMANVWSPRMTPISVDYLHPAPAV
jgi:hypothetical protein